MDFDHYEAATRRGLAAALDFRAWPLRLAVYDPHRHLRSRPRRHRGNSPARLRSAMNARAAPRATSTSGSSRTSSTAPLSARAGRELQRCHLQAGGGGSMKTYPRHAFRVSVVAAALLLAGCNANQAVNPSSRTASQVFAGHYVEDNPLRSHQLRAEQHRARRPLIHADNQLHRRRARRRHGGNPAPRRGKRMRRPRPRGFWAGPRRQELNGLARRRRATAQTGSQQ